MKSCGPFCSQPLNSHQIQILKVKIWSSWLLCNIIDPVKKSWDQTIRSVSLVLDITYKKVSSYLLTRSFQNFNSLEPGLFISYYSFISLQTILIYLVSVLLIVKLPTLVTPGVWLYCHVEIRTRTWTTLPPPKFLRVEHILIAIEQI